jgi:cyclopropane fatty-acyl-phospholipid synthase-like methyltransferase
MLRDSAYWDEFYSLEHNEIKEPSKFAEFIFNNFLLNKSKASLIEFGCGNGRDSLYFNAKGIDVVAIDGSHIAIESLQKQNQKYKRKA